VLHQNVAQAIICQHVTAEAQVW